MTLQEILSALNPEQARAASAIDGPVLVLAGAGTGKTRVITYRIAYMLAMGILPESILGLTFTNKAAREMRERLARLVEPRQATAVTLGTFHAFCVKILRRDIKFLGYLPGFSIADEQDQQGLLKQAAAQLGFLKEDTPFAAIAAKISDWKNRLLTPAEAHEDVITDFDATAHALYREYQTALELQNMIDFDDMLMLVFRLFDEHPDILARYREQYRYLLVDEYQDTNAAQFTIVKMLAGDRCNLCVVGDDDQSIYSWRGADIKNILNFPDMFPGTTEIKLEQNYRSTNTILDAANAVIRKNAERHEKKLWSQLGKGEEISVVAAENAEKEAEFIAAMIKQEMAQNDTLQYGDFAVLYRSNHLSRQLEQTFLQCGVPYRLVGGQEFFKRKEIKDAVSYLKLVVNPRDNQSLLRILACPPRGLAQKAVEQLKFLHSTEKRPMVDFLGTQEFQKTVSSKGAAAAQSLADAIEEAKKSFAEPGNLTAKATLFLNAVGYRDGLQRMYKDIEDAQKRRENLDEFLGAIAQYEHKFPAAGMADYLENFALLEENDRTEENLDPSQTVTLSSVHASKGLEYNTVFVIAMEKDSFPHERALEERSLDEELRLFYVAITRAKRKLFLSCCGERYYRGSRKFCMASPFLELLPEELTGHYHPDDLIEPMTEDDTRAAFAKIFAMLDKR